MSAPAPSVTGTPLDVDDAALAAVNFGDQDLIPAVVQDVEDGTVLMVGYMDPEALRRTLATGRTWFWSRSRREYWQKGETSGDRQFVREVRVDCDGDTLMVLVDQHGRGACHTGERSCFYRTVGTGPGVPAPAHEHTHGEHSHTHGEHSDTHADHVDPHTDHDQDGPGPDRPADPGPDRPRQR